MKPEKDFDRDTVRELLVKKLREAKGKSYSARQLGNMFGVGGAGIPERRCKMIIHECHITIEPVFGKRLALAKRIADAWGFKVASLLMVKDDGTTEPSRRDTFMTSHSPIYEIIEINMRLCVGAMQASGFNVLRYKIELIMLDSKYQRDPLNILDRGMAQPTANGVGDPKGGA